LPEQKGSLEKSGVQKIPTLALELWQMSAGAAKARVVPAGCRLFVKLSLVALKEVVRRAFSSELSLKEVVRGNDLERSRPEGIFPQTFLERSRPGK